MPPKVLWSKTIAESLGTFAIVFFGCGSLRIIYLFPGSISPSAVPIIFGLTVAVMIYALGHISGAHFNPAVTLAFSLAKRFPFNEVGFYWLAQFAGAFLAVGLLRFLIPGMDGFGAVAPNVPPLQALGWEVLLTFFLMLVIIAVATDSRAVDTMAGAAIGGVVTVGSFVGGPITGAAMNPARFLAPAVAEGKLDYWWVYLIGSFLGAGLAAVTYEKIRCETSSSKNSNGCC